MKVEVRETNKYTKHGEVVIDNIVCGSGTIEQCEALAQELREDENKAKVVLDIFKAAEKYL